MQDTTAVDALGRDYPAPMVDRRHALERYDV
jgi:hypothetical protein